MKKAKQSNRQYWCNKNIYIYNSYYTHDKVSEKNFHIQNFSIDFSIATLTQYIIQ